MFFLSSWGIEHSPVLLCRPRTSLVVDAAVDPGSADLWGRGRWDERGVGADVLDRDIAYHGQQNARRTLRVWQLAHRAFKSTATRLVEKFDGLKNKGGVRDVGLRSGFAGWDHS